MQRRPPSLESLRVFEACVRNASFTRAAAELGVTPSAVSLRIRDLEADMGVTLFVRAGPRVIATDAGRVMAGRIGDALGRMRAAVDTCARTTQALRLSAPPSFAARWLSPRLAAYHALPGAVPIRLEATAEVRGRGAFDLAIRTGLGDWADLETVRLMPVDAAPMLSPALRAGASLDRPEQLADLPLLPHDDWQRWFAEGNLSPPALQFAAIDYPTHDLDALAAVDGAGVALLSPTLFASLLEQGALVQPFARTIVGPAWHYLVLHRDEARAAVLQLADWITAQTDSFRR
ncbi:LysR family transcriptional regulator [Sphingomonas alpina]|uniref:LysR family transcriptional regulator n=1 Tax=Sphingomonas alpina TaxID=653931 RepID=UPI001E4ECDE0|nr:LysR family transcriptional regulator [Sphingomonas alpina]